MAFDPVKLQQVRERIENACARSGRNPVHIQLLAATKYASIDDMNAALKAGISLFGENRIQDAAGKFPHLVVPDGFKLAKHFIGHLQTNKVKRAVQFFDVIESVDSLRLAKALDVEAAKAGRVLPVLVEVNVAGDEKKFGVFEGELSEVLSGIVQLPHLELRGLMTIVPSADDLDTVRPYFGAMRDLFDTYGECYPTMTVLSMGMSHDFEVAIEEGATEVRIGGLLFE